MSDPIHHHQQQQQQLPPGVDHAHPMPELNLGLPGGGGGDQHPVVAQQQQQQQQQQQHQSVVDDGGDEVEPGGETGDPIKDENGGHRRFFPRYEK